MRTSNDRFTVHTGLYTRKAEKLLKAVFNYLVVNQGKMFTTDENIVDGCSLLYHNIFADVWFYNTFTEVTIGFYKYLDDSYKQYVMDAAGSHANFKKIIARFLRRFIERTWKNRDNDIIKVKSSVHEDARYVKMICLSALELELICDVLEENDISKYKKSIVKKIVGKPLNLIQYEMMCTSKEEIESIKKMYADKIQTTKNECNGIIDTINLEANQKIKQISDETALAREKVLSEYRTKINAFNEEMNAKIKNVKNMIKHTHTDELKWS